MDVLDGSYIKGYTAGLFMAKEIIDYIGIDLKLHHVSFNKKTLLRVMDVAIDGREALRENPEAFVRYNTGKKDFEVYEP